MIEESTREGRQLVKIARPLLDDIIEHATGEPHQEVCGVLGGKPGIIERVYRAQNMAKTPAVRFEFFPRELMDILDNIDTADLNTAGFYHSHIASSPYPSRTDVNEWNPEWYPDAVYFICSLKNPIQPEVRAFRFDEDKHLVEEPIEISS
ncbi:MAG TPA: M67 family metallopeptidase [Chloroflexota bacterium]|jgi:proteasome lid subunit RPN8/RPN11